MIETMQWDLNGQMTSANSCNRCLANVRQDFSSGICEVMLPLWHSCHEFVSCHEGSAVPHQVFLVILMCHLTHLQVYHQHSNHAILWHCRQVIESSLFCQNAQRSTTCLPRISIRNSEAIINLKEMFTVYMLSTRV